MPPCICWLGIIPMFEEFDMLEVVPKACGGVPGPEPMGRDKVFPDGIPPGIEGPLCIPAEPMAMLVGLLMEPIPDGAPCIIDPATFESAAPIMPGIGPAILPIFCCVCANEVGVPIEEPMDGVPAWMPRPAVGMLDDGAGEGSPIDPVPNGEPDKVDGIP